MPRQQPERTHNLPDKQVFRRQVRSKLTPAEATLWTILKKAKIDGRKFRRQHSVGPYVLDFYCPQEQLAIELDGEGHFGPLGQLRDRKRKKYLNKQGIKVVRFENELVFKESEFVLERLRGFFGWKDRREET